ncbi:MAG: ABC transporter ATP-binding protein [Albidovulum sp.]|nr:ABC transporter ATP-binding protein [Albidovulum sp.]MDE0532018.1 ABC transporter ATP-binding protein [Albidovulum sp.]
MSDVEIQSAVKKYGRFTAVDSLDLTVSGGEFVTLLGPSGCGKTTTLRMVGGFVRPTSGRIRISDEDVTDKPPQKRKVGFVFQNYALFPHMDVARNVGFGLRMANRERSEREKRVAEILSMVRLGHLSDRMPSQLSGGQQQRVALARALIIQPSVLLLDEPFGALDKQLRDHMRVELRELQRSLGISTLFVTHDQDEALSMSDRIVVMSEGKAAQLGSPSEIYERPNSKFVAEFMGHSNIFDCLVEDVSKDGASISLNGVGFFTNSPSARKGSRMTAMIRPENIEFADSGEKRGDATVAATVAGMEYLGSTVQVTLSLEAGISLVARQTNTESATGSKLRTGQNVAVRIPPEAVRLL